MALWRPPLRTTADCRPLSSSARPAPARELHSSAPAFPVDVGPIGSSWCIWARSHHHADAETVHPHALASRPLYTSRPHRLSRRSPRTRSFWLKLSTDSIPSSVRCICEHYPFRLLMNIPVLCAIAVLVCLVFRLQRRRSLMPTMSAYLLGLVLPGRGMLAKDDFWSEPSLSTYTFSIAKMLLYDTSSLYDRMDSEGPSIPGVVHRLPPMHIASAASAA